MIVPQPHGESRSSCFLWRRSTTLLKLEDEYIRVVYTYSIGCNDVAAEERGWCNIPTPTLAMSFLERSGHLEEVPVLLYTSGDRERRGGLLGGME